MNSISATYTWFLFYIFFDHRCGYNCRCILTSSPSPVIYHNLLGYFSDSVFRGGSHLNFTSIYVLLIRNLSPFQYKMLCNFISTSRCWIFMSMTGYNSAPEIKNFHLLALMSSGLWMNAFADHSGKWEWKTFKKNRLSSSLAPSPPPPLFFFSWTVPYYCIRW